MFPVLDVPVDKVTVNKEKTAFCFFFYILLAFENLEHHTIFMLAVVFVFVFVFSHCIVMVTNHLTRLN